MQNIRGSELPDCSTWYTILEKGNPYQLPKQGVGAIVVEKQQRMPSIYPIKAYNKLINYSANMCIKTSKWLPIHIFWLYVTRLNSCHTLWSIIFKLEGVVQDHFDRVHHTAIWGRNASGHVSTFKPLLFGTNWKFNVRKGTKNTTTSRKPTQIEGRSRNNAHMGANLPSDH